MKTFIVATKAFVVDGDKFLVIKRHENDDFKPGLIDLPGGRLEFGERPEDGLKREVKEEVNLDVKVKEPTRVWTLMKDRNTQIVGITFLCEKIAGNEKLSHEHSGFRWIRFKDYKMSGIFHPVYDWWRKALL